MVHEVTILSGRRQPTGSGVTRFRAYPLIGSLLIAAFVVMFLFAADGGGGRTRWDVATASVGVVVAMWLAGGWWSGWGPARRQSGHVYHLSQVTPECLPVIREPESGWWNAQPEPTPTAMTVAVLRESDTRWTADAVVSRLAELAVHDELLVVHGSRNRAALGHHAVTAGLREQLPRHHVVAVHVDYEHGGLGRGTAAVLEHLLENGSLPVVTTPPAAVADVAAEISSCLRADRVLRVSGSTNGIDLHQVWRRRHETASVG